jgi:hypothetical protein
VILQQWLSNNLAALRCLPRSVEKLSFLWALLYIRLYVDDGEQQGEVSYSLVACLNCFQYHVSFFDVVDADCASQPDAPCDLWAVPRLRCVDPAMVGRRVMVGTTVVARCRVR